MQIREIRNLRKWYLIDHTLFGYNKKNEPITRQQLSILLAIYFASISLPVVNTYRLLSNLREHRKTIRPDVLSRQLKKLEQKELIKRNLVGRSNVFEITVTGIIELQEIEKRNRMCRI